MYRFSCQYSLINDPQSAATGSNKKTQKKKSVLEPVLVSKPCIPHLLWNTCKFKRKCRMIHDLPGFPKLCQRYLSNPNNSNCSKHCSLEHMSKAKAQDIAFNLAKKLQTPTATTSKQSLPGKEWIQSHVPCPSKSKEVHVR